MLGAVKLNDVNTVEFNTSKTPYAPDEGFTATVPLQQKLCPLNITVKDDSSFNIPILRAMTQRHPWRNYMPSEYCYNSWIIAINEEEPITAARILDTLNCLRKNGATEVFMQLHKRSAYNGTLLNECRSLFNQFERPPP